MVVWVTAGSPRACVGVDRRRGRSDWGHSVWLLGGRRLGETEPTVKARRRVDVQHADLRISVVGEGVYHAGRHAHECAGASDDVWSALLSSPDGALISEDDGGVVLVFVHVRVRLVVVRLDGDDARSKRGVSVLRARNSMLSTVMAGARTDDDDRPYVVDVRAARGWAAHAQISSSCTLSGSRNTRVAKGNGPCRSVMTPCGTSSRSRCSVHRSRSPRCSTWMAR